MWGWRGMGILQIAFISLGKEGKAVLGVCLLNLNTGLG